MEFAIALDFGGWTVLVLGALVFGAIAQYVGEAETGWEWLISGLGAGIGALAASEFIVGWRAFEPVWGGLAIVPAVMGGFVVGLAVEVVTRYLSGGTYVHRPTAA